MGVTLKQIQKTVDVIATVATVIKAVTALAGSENSAAAIRMEQALQPVTQKLARQLTAYSMRRRRKIARR